MSQVLHTSVASAVDAGYAGDRQRLARALFAQEFVEAVSVEEVATDLPAAGRGFNVFVRLHSDNWPEMKSSRVSYEVWSVLPVGAWANITVEHGSSRFALVTSKAASTRLEPGQTLHQWKKYSPGQIAQWTVEVPPQFNGVVLDVPPQTEQDKKDRVLRGVTFSGVLSGKLIEDIAAKHREVWHARLRDTCEAVLKALDGDFDFKQLPDTEVVRQRLVEALMSETEDMRVELDVNGYVSEWVAPEDRYWIQDADEDMETPPPIFLHGDTHHGAPQPGEVEVFTRGRFVFPVAELDRVTEETGESIGTLVSTRTLPCSDCDGCGRADGCDTCHGEGLVTVAEVEVGEPWKMNRPLTELKDAEGNTWLAGPLGISRKPGEHGVYRASVEETEVTRDALARYVGEHKAPSTEPSPELARAYVVFESGAMLDRACRRVGIVRHHPDETDASLRERTLAVMDRARPVDPDASRHWATPEQVVADLQSIARPLSADVRSVSKPCYHCSKVGGTHLAGCPKDVR